MSTRITATTGVLDTLEVRDIRVLRDATPLKWSARTKHPHINLLNGGTTAKLSLIRSGAKGILSTEALLIGADSFAWSYTIQQGDTIQVGLAEVTRDLTTLDPNGDHVATQLAVTSGTRIVLLLDAMSLTIEYGAGKTVVDMTAHAGKTMHPWLSDVPGGSGFSIDINNYEFINMCIDPDGNGRIETKSAVGTSNHLIIDAGDSGIGLGSLSMSNTNIATNPGESFSVTMGSSGNGLTVEDPDGDVLIDTTLKTNRIEPKDAVPLVINGGGDNSLTINQDGHLTVDPGYIFTTQIRAPAGDDLILTSDNGLGIDIIDPSGEVQISGPALKSDVTDTRSAIPMTLGAVTASKVEVGKSGAITEVKGNLDVAEGLDVTGNITVTGTVDGVDIAAAVADITGSVTVHSDVSSAGSGAIITVGERASIADVSNKLSLSGGTMTGLLGTQSINPVVHDTYDIGHTVIRYKDVYLSGNIDTNGDINLNGSGKVFNCQDPTNPQDVVTLNYFNSNAGAITDADSGLHVRDTKARLGGDLITDATINLRSLKRVDFTNYGAAVTDEVQNTTGASNTGTFVPLLQPFEIVSSGVLTRIDIGMFSAEGGENTTLRLRTGNGGGGPVIRNIAITKVTPTITWEFHSPVVVEAGEVYTFDMLDGSGIRFGSSAYPYKSDFAGLVANFTTYVASTTPMVTMDGPTGFMGIGLTSPQRTLHISDVMRLEPSTTPGSASAGDIYYDSSTNKLRVYNGTMWVDLH